MTDHATDEVSLFMEKLGFHEDAEILRRENVSMRILRKMTSDDFKNIGITFGHSFEIREALEIIPMQDETKELDIGACNEDERIEFERSSDVVSDEDSDESPPSPPSISREKFNQYKKRKSGQFRLSNVDKDHLKVFGEKTDESAPFSGQGQSKSVKQISDTKNESNTASIREKIKPLPRARKNPPKKRNSSDVSEGNTSISPDFSVRGEIKPIKSLSGGDIIVPDVNNEKSQSPSVHEKMGLLYARETQQSSEKHRLTSSPPSIPEIGELFQERDRKEMQSSDEDSGDPPRPSVRQKIKSLNLDSSQTQVSGKNSDVLLSSSEQVNIKQVSNRDSRKIHLPAEIVEESKSFAAHENSMPVGDSDSDSDEALDENMYEYASRSGQYKRNSKIQGSSEDSFVDPNSSNQEDINPSNERDDSHIQAPEKAQDVSPYPSIRDKIKSFNNPQRSEFQVPPNKDTGSDQQTDLRVILIGKTGTGKSSTANTILGGHYFSTSSSGSSVTDRCFSKSASRFGRNIQVIDTPGLFDTSLSLEQTEEEIIKCIAMSAPGPHAFILVLNISRFTKEEKETALRFFELFENAVYNYFIVLFTRFDDLEYEGITLAEHLQSVPDNLGSILTKCHGRYTAFNNRETGAKQDQQVQQLLEIIDKNILARETKYYTDKMFQEAERLLKAKEEEMRRNLEHQKEEKYEGLRREIEAKYKNQEENIRARLENIDGHYRKIEGSIASKKTEIAEFIKKMKEEKVMIEKKAKEIEQRKETELQELQTNQIEDKVPVELLRVSVLQSLKDEGTKLSNFIKSSQTVISIKTRLSNFFKRS